MHFPIRMAPNSQAKSLCDKGLRAYTMGLHALSDLECTMSWIPYPSDRTDAQWQLRVPLIRRPNRAPHLARWRAPSRSWISAGGTATARSRPQHLWADAGYRGPAWAA